MSLCEAAVLELRVQIKCRRITTNIKGTFAVSWIVTGFLTHFYINPDRTVLTDASDRGSVLVPTTQTWISPPLKTDPSLFHFMFEPKFRTEVTSAFSN